MTAHAKTAEPSIVNGINLDDLFALIGGIKRDASNPRTPAHGASPNDPAREPRARWR